MHVEDAAAARIGVEEIRELGDRTGGEIEERQRLDGRTEPSGQAGGILRRLHLDTAQRVALRLRFEDADGLAVHEE